MAANCVTSQQKKSPEYIGAMEKLDISSSVLELLLFEYQSLPENEEAFSKGELPFPSIEYLQGQLYAPAITVLNGTIIEYYDKHFGKPFTAKTLQEANNIAHVIGKRIGRESVRIVETKDGQYKVLTTRPKLDKSATDNIGTFSRESDNIYYNKTKELFNIINKVNWTEELGNKQSTEHGLVYKEHGKYYITLGDIFKDDVTFYGDEFEKSITPFLQAHINNNLIAAGLNPNVVKVNITKTGKLELKTADKISKNKKQLISTKSIETVLSFLEAKIPGLNHKVVAENSMILKRLNISDSVNAFFNEGTVYLIEGRFNEDIAIEECLHPLVNAIALENIELYDLLVETAKTEFPTLFEEIKLSYKEEDVNKELVTQALSRYTRKEFKEQKNERTKWEQLVNNFFNFVKDLFGIISIKNIKPTTTFKELSQIILSEDGYFDINLSGREYNKILTQLDNVSWARTVENSYEVSSQGDKRFSALYATFKEGTIIDGEDVGGKTIEWVYQNIIKKSGKGKAPSKDSKLFIPSREGYKGDITPSEDTIFVFGSNPEGRHGAGAARVAKDKFGAQYGVGEGLTGNAYALPTKDLRIKENKGLRSISKESIIESIKTLYKVATENPGKQFKVAFRNKLDETTLNGYTGEEMIDMFLSAGPIPSNIIFSEEWLNTGKFNLSKQEIEDFSYEKGYLPLWQEWAKQNPELIEELRKATVGKTLTDKFASTRVSQARALADILNSNQYSEKLTQETSEKEDTPNVITYTDPLSDAIDTLLGIDSILDRSEVQELAHKICTKISDILTTIQKDPSIVENITNGRIKGTPEMSKMRRNKLMLTVGATDIVNYVKELVFGQYNENVTDDMLELADLLYLQFNSLLNIGMSSFAATEGFSFSFTGNNSIVSDSVENLEDLDEAELSENEGSRLEAWLVEAVTKSVIDRMSQSVKAVLQSCNILDSEGKPILDRWGLADNVSLQDATQTIVKVTSGSFTLSDMIEKLEKATKNFPWIQQLLPMLKDKSGKYSQFQSQFYGAMQSHFLLYNVVRTEDGKIATKPVNKDTALSEAKKAVVSLYNIRQHPLFDSNGNVNKTSLQLLETLQEELKNEQIEDKTPIVNSILQLLGYNTDISSIQSMLNESIIKTVSDTLHYIIKDLNNHKEDKLSTWKPFSSNPKDKGIINNIGKILKPFTDATIDPTLSSFHSDGKMYQSNKIPSYLTKLFLKFRELSNTENSSIKLTDYNQFLKDEYGFSEWFRDTNEDLGIEVNLEMQKGWRLPWLRMLASDPKTREIFAHKVDISFDKKGYMKSSTGKYMNELEYGLMSIAEYFSETSEKNAQEDRVPAWFRVPMQSNKPSADYIRFYSYRGQNYKQAIVNDLLDVFNLELSRMQTCVMRKQKIAEDKSIEISSFDKNGTKFCFLDFLETKRKDSEFGKLIDKKINGQEINEAKLLSLAELLITESIDLRVLEIYSEFEANGLVKQLSKVKGINTSNIKESVENFLWNDFLASINILQLTITDVAYYKNAEDLQKRLAQIHAPGTRPNIEARDLEGNTITDGTYRTLILEDFEGIKSNIIENLKFVFELKLSELDDNNPNKVAAKAVYDNIISMFETLINVTDAQGYSCPTSYRKKALMFGKWSQRHEDIYLKLLKGEFSLSDIEEAFGPLKPFVYSNTTRDSYAEGAPIQKLKTGVQYKNSEYLLVMADALLKGVRNGRPNLLKAIFKVMEDSYDKVGKTKGIDTILFVSSMKTGISGAVSLNDLVEDADGYKKAKARLESVMYNEDGSYNTKHVHLSAFEDYCIQQEVPPHFKNHHQAHGSQIRAITPSDLDVNATYKVGNQEYSAQEFIKEYERLITENIKESFKSLSKELEWSSETNHTEEGRANLRRNLSEILQRELLSSQRHSLDLLFACSLKNGDFRVPLGDAVQSNKIELLINSIIKNRINKQEIAGGPVVQASGFGMSRQLNIVFKDSKGNPLMTLKQYKELGGTEESFKKYIKDNQGSISHFEVFAPIYDERLLEFLDADGTIDVKTIEKLNPELLDLVAYRIPTEDKYSTIPCKIVGFVPREAGEVIMMPEEITLLTGSDYDVDKMYLMRKEFVLKKKSQEQIIQIMQEKLPSASIEQIKNFLLELKERPYATRKKYPSVWKAYKESAFEAALPKDLRIVRNNKIVDMTLAVLTHPSTTALQMTPGGFEELRKVGYMVEAFKLGKGTWAALEKMSINLLKDLCYTSKNLNFFDTQLQFYKQNSAAGSILAIFAVAKVAHAIFLTRKIHIDVKKAMGIKQKGGFSILLGNSELTPMMRLDATHNDLGQYIGKVLGEMVASSADAVKDPVLNLMNINVETVNILNSLLRVGVPFKTAAMFLSSKAITDALNQYYTESLTQNMSFTQVIKNKLKEFNQEHNILWIYEGLSNEELLDAIKGGDPKLDIKVLQMFLGISNLASAVQKASFITRFNSMSSAVGPLVIDNLITERKLTEFPQDIIYLEKDGQKTVQTVETMLNEFPILKSFKQTLDLSRMIFGEEIITNSRGFRQMLHGIPDGTFKTLMSDRNALCKLGDFYKSAILVYSDVFNSEDLKYYIHDFPKDFISKNYKEKFANNRFIQLLKYNIEKSERLSLGLELTGMDKRALDKITAAWLDLYKSGEEGEKLAIDLVKYYFFKGGIGFSPKTPLHLLPVQLRQVIPGYMDAFGKKRTTPNASLVYKQFVQNYWQNNKIAPIKKYKLDLSELEGQENVYFTNGIPESMEGAYFKMKNEKGEYDLFYVYYTAKEFAEVHKIPKLGNNGEYLEINSSDLKPLEENISNELEIIDETEQVEVSSLSPQIEDVEQIDIENKDDISYKEQLESVLNTLLKERLNKLKDMSKDELVIKKWPTIAWMMKQLKAHGIEVTMDLLEKTFEEYC